jgi:hypothetical protein
MTFAFEPIDSTNSLASLDFPIPASPTTVNRVAVPDRAVRRNAVRTWVSSAWRPNIGESSNRGTAGAPATTSSTCQAATPPASAARSWAGFSTTAPRMSHRVAAATITSPSRPACCRRLAVDTT